MITDYFFGFRPGAADWGGGPGRCPAHPLGPPARDPPPNREWAAQFRVGDPGWDCHPLPFGSVEQALIWRGVGVIRKEPASVSVPAGRRPRDFTTPLIG